MAKTKWTGQELTLSGKGYAPSDVKDISWIDSDGNDYDWNDEDKRSWSQAKEIYVITADGEYYTLTKGNMEGNTEVWLDDMVQPL